MLDVGLPEITFQLFAKVHFAFNENVGRNKTRMKIDNKSLLHQKSSVARLLELASIKV